TGTIISLQRQLEIQESELWRIRSENEMLQKQLREEKDHFEAMSERFGGLTKEERKEERIAMIKEENRSLKQVVTEQESQLAKQKELISDLEGTIRRLRLDLVTSRHHIQKQEQAQKEIQNKAEALEQKELQTRVVLERMSSKFERYRSRIIQAAFSVEGSQHPPVELNDEQVLEELQVRGSSKLSFQQ
ncbi:CCD27 protein, partial [Scytalopus superciliaris]|nr:CCD27 protein [Scytalopus superciliaris]